MQREVSTLPSDIHNVITTHFSFQISRIRPAHARVKAGKAKQKPFRAGITVYGDELTDKGECCKLFLEEGTAGVQCYRRTALYIEYLDSHIDR